MNNDEILISVVIPVFNEELTIGNVIERLAVGAQKTGFKHELIIVDDCSKDGSVEISKSYSVKVFSLETHVGKGYVLRLTFTKAKGEIVTTIDSDGAHRPEELTRLLTPILQNNASLVIGSRELNQNLLETKKLNATGVRLFNFLIRVFIKADISDSQSGYRVMKASVLGNMRLNSNGYEIEFEMLLKTIRQSFRVGEAPISFEQRTYGASRLDPAADGFNILFSIILAYLRDG
ncbi:glycosyltransferase family 2 protein [Candidatus Bathyarchaeota archaeon]|nr:glycosyltransferase family 2 protein [Candidatus Bathyarchaeota archaeon]